MKLYTYVLRYDTGSAPNPYWGICTLVICKPVIRRTAEIDDWVVGFCSASFEKNKYPRHIVYGMKITAKMTMQEYDEYCQQSCPEKIPDWGNRDYRRRVGDCIYDYSNGREPVQRVGVHTEENIERDLGGCYALISTHYCYFGDRPRKLPQYLTPIVHQTQGHKSNANADYVGKFDDWVESLGLTKNKLHGKPQLRKEIMNDQEARSKCAARDIKIAIEDEEASAETV
jgi:hypothetical protein